MNKGAVMLIAGVGLLLVLLGATATNKAKEWASKIKLSVTGIGKPSIKSNTLTLPLKLKLHNPSPIALPVSNFVVAVSMAKEKAWINVASTEPTGKFTINPGDNIIEVTPSIDFKKLDQAVSFTDLVANLKNFIGGSGLPSYSFMIDAIASIGGIDIPVSYPYTLDLNKI